MPRFFLPSSCSQPEQGVQRQDVNCASDQVSASVPPNYCPGEHLACCAKSSLICDLPIIFFLKEMSMHIFHLLDCLSKHQLQGYMLRSFERSLLCESGEQWLGKRTSVVVEYFIYHKFDSSSFPEVDSCTVTSRNAFTEKESVPGDVLCLSIGMYFHGDTLILMLKVLFKASCTPECRYF